MNEKVILGALTGRMKVNVEVIGAVKQQLIMPNAPLICHSSTLCFRMHHASGESVCPLPWDFYLKYSVTGQGDVIVFQTV